MQTKKKYKQLKHSRKNRKLQKGGANYTMRNYNDGRLPEYYDVYQPDYSNPWPPDILGGEWYRDGYTADGKQKYRWRWYYDNPLCGDGVGRDDRLWCANRGFDQETRDNWCRINGADCYRCANSGYCTHEGRPDEDYDDSDSDDDYDDDDSEWEEAPEELYDPSDPAEIERKRLEKLRRIEEEAMHRRPRLPCNPVPRTCDDVPIEEGKECLGGRCSACENNRDITDPIDLEMIPTGKGVCIDRKCYNADTLRDALRHMPELPYNRKPFTEDDLDNALKQVICTGESRDPGPSSSRDPGPSSSRDHHMGDGDSEIEKLKQQAQQIQIQLRSLSSIQTLEEEIRGYSNIYSMLEQEITMFKERYKGIISDAQFKEITEAKQRNLLDINETILNLQKQKQQKQELQDELTAVMMVLQESIERNREGGKKYKKNKKNTKKYKNKIIKTKNKKNTVKKYKIKKRKNTVKRYKNKKRKNTKKIIK